MKTHNRLFKEAIAENKVLILTVKDELTGEPYEIRFDPYILGTDILQKSFIWGKLRNSTFYKCYYRMDVVAIEKLEELFKLDSEAIYLYKLMEKHSDVLKGLENIFIRGVPKIWPRPHA